MATWPANIPQAPETQGYGEEPGFPVIQAPVDGPPLSRRRFTAAVKSYTAVFFFDYAELAIFEAFYENDLGFGALAYDWRERGIATNPVRQFRITTKPAISHAGGNFWRVALQLIRLP